MRWQFVQGSLAAKEEKEVAATMRKRTARLAVIENSDKFLIRMLFFCGFEYCRGVVRTVLPKESGLYPSEPSIFPEICGDGVFMNAIANKWLGEAGA